MFGVILALVILALLTVFSKRVQQFWISPATFFSLVWLFYMTGGVILAPDFRPMPLGAWILVLFSSSVIAGSLMVPGILSKEEHTTISGEKTNLRLRLLYNIGLLLSGISTIGILFVIFFGFTRFQLEQNIFSLLVLPNLYATDRYDEILDLPFFIKSVMFLTYPGALIGGFTSNFYQGIKKWGCFLPVIITFFYGTIFAVRAGILLAIILTFSGMLCAKVYTRAPLNRWFRRVYVSGAGVGLVLLGTYFLIQWLRKGPVEHFFISELIVIAKAGILGSFSAFTKWFQFSYNLGNAYGFGIYTLAGPMEILGLTVRESGFFTDYAQIGASETNIYTAFRGLIEDFGIIGTVILCAVTGFFSSISFKATREGKIMWIVPLSAFYTFTLFSPLLSIFAFNSIIISFFIFAGAILLSKKNCE